MANPVHVFYYSRKKLGLYLMFNILLLALAVLFTLTIFPDYPSVYYFALGSCALSLLAALLVFVLPLRLAVVSPEAIKIDRCQALAWQDIHSIRKVKIGTGLFSKTILRLEPKKLTGYKMNFMQRLIKKSEFGAFSIPMYAMSLKSARKIERLIRKCHATVRPQRRKHPKD